MEALVPEVGFLASAMLLSRSPPPCAALVSPPLAAQADVPSCAIAVGAKLTPCAPRHGERFLGWITAFLDLSPERVLTLAVRATLRERREIGGRDQVGNIAIHQSITTVPIIRTPVSQDQATQTCMTDLQRCDIRRSSLEDSLAREVVQSVGQKPSISGQGLPQSLPAEASGNDGALRKDEDDHHIRARHETDEGEGRQEENHVAPSGCQKLRGYLALKAGDMQEEYSKLSAEVNDKCTEIRDKHPELYRRNSQSQRHLPIFPSGHTGRDSIDCEGSMMRMAPALGTLRLASETLTYLQRRLAETNDSIARIFPRISSSAKFCLAVRVRSFDFDDVDGNFVDFQYRPPYLDYSARVYPEEDVHSHSLQVDHFFDRRSTNRQIFGALKPVIGMVTSGLDVCIVTNGANETGKTSTMFFGPDAIAYSSLDLIVDWRNQHVSRRCKRTITLSARTFTPDGPVDLLCSPTERGQSSHAGSVDEYSTVTQEVRTKDNAREAVYQARKRYLDYREQNNAASSRAPLVCSLELIEKPGNRVSRLLLVDLVGSGLGDHAANLDVTQYITKPADPPHSDLGHRRIDHAQGPGDDVAPVDHWDQLFEFLTEQIADEHKIIYLAHLSPLVKDFASTLSTLYSAAQVSL